MSAIGWTYAPGGRDAVAKTHGALLPYEDLPMEQKIKDSVFGAIVRTLLVNAQ